MPNKTASRIAYGGWHVPIEIARGEGSYVWDIKGKKYVDFIAGWAVGNVGWGRAVVVDAQIEVAKRGVLNFSWTIWKKWEELAELLAQSTKLDTVYRCTSGSEAVDMAIKVARAAGRNKGIVSVNGVYHGHTYGAAAAGDVCNPNMSPCVPEFYKIPMPKHKDEESARASVRAFEELVRKHSIGAFLSESVWSNAGAIVPHASFYKGIEEICNKHNILLIMDEVATGFGRCGRMMAHELWSLNPDIVCLGKGIAGGYGGLGATVVKKSIADIVETIHRIPMFSTFGWTPVHTAAAIEVIKIIRKEKLWKNAEKVGKYALSRLEQLEHPSIVQARGQGLLLGLEMEGQTADKVWEHCLRKGLFIETAGPTLYMTPPLSISKKEIDEGMEILGKVLRSL